MRHIVAFLTALAIVTVVVPPRAAEAISPSRVLPLGDSITAGFVWREGPPADPSTWNGYREPLRWQLGAAGYSVDFVGSLSNGTFPDPENEGWGGHRCDQLIPRAQAAAAAYQPDVVLLMCGTNDLAQNYDLPNLPARLGQVIDAIHAVRPEARVIVSTIPPIINAPLGQQVSAYNAAIPAVVVSRAIVGKRVTFVDAGASVGANWLSLSDGTHPSEHGYRELAGGWFAALTRVLPSPTAPTPPPVPTVAPVQVPTPEPTAAPSLACTPRPPIQVTTQPLAPGVLRITLIAQLSGNAIQSVSFGPAQNVQPVTDLAVNGPVATFTLRRLADGPTHLPFTVTDACGPWTSFVGGGGSAF